MDFDRHCTETVTQTELLTTGLGTADLRAPVPSCPGWSLGNLVRHIGGGHRWAEEVVRTRATGFLPDDHVRKLDGPGRTLALTDSGAAWFVDLTGDAIAWCRGRGQAAVTVRGSYADLLLVIYRRRAVDGNGIELVGDAELLDFWLGHVAFA